MELGGRFGGVGTLLPPRGSQGLNSGLQAFGDAFAHCATLPAQNSCLDSKEKYWVEEMAQSVSSVLATQAGEPELNPQHHVNSSTEVGCAGLCF